MCKTLKNRPYTMWDRQKGGGVLLAEAAKNFCRSS